MSRQMPTALVAGFAALSLAVIAPADQARAQQPRATKGQPTGAEQGANAGHHRRMGNDGQRVPARESASIRQDHGAMHPSLRVPPVVREGIDRGERVGVEIRQFEGAAAGGG